MRALFALFSFNLSSVTDFCFTFLLPKSAKKSLQSVSRSPLKNKRHLFKINVAIGVARCLLPLLGGVRKTNFALANLTSHHSGVLCFKAHVSERWITSAHADLTRFGSNQRNSMLSFWLTPCPHRNRGRILRRATPPRGYSDIELVPIQRFAAQYSDSFTIRKD